MKRQTQLIAITTLAVLGASVAVGTDLPVNEIATELVERGRAYGNWAVLPYLFIYVVAAVLGLSRTLLNVLAGVVFTPAIAVLAVFAASTIAFATTFCIARFIAHDWVEQKLQKLPAARSFMKAIDTHGFRLLILMRMNPLIPGFINGYGFGLTTIRPTPYMLASIVGSLPLSMLHVYLGWAGGAMLVTNGELPGDVQNNLLITGCVLTLVLIVAISWFAQHSMKSERYAVRGSDNAGETPGGQAP